MNSRERVFTALRFERPDRAPIDFWASRRFKRKLEKALGLPLKRFLDANDVDLRYIEGPAYIGPPLRQFADGSEADIWGVRRRMVEVPAEGGAAESYEEVENSPLAGALSPEDVDAYDGWPSPDGFDYSDIERQCDDVRAESRVAVFMGDRLNRVAQLKPAMYLRGIENILVDLSLNPEIAAAIIRHIRDFYLAYTERIIDAAHGKLDILLTGDDFGSQNAPLISPAMWEQFLGDGFGRYVQLATSNGIKVMHHTCGAVCPIIPLMVARGLDILQSVQPEADGMDSASLKREFGARLAFQGGISIQRTMPFGSAADIHREVQDRMATLGAGGGYILCTSHNIQADTPVAQVLELFKAYHRYGRYD
ncbi:MAG: hypothetical protein A3K19_26920 [Lentisphaerae bacterium RIFOXYB12_FULL_65_16]|nr:MAG: hypothetical protein A3K18_23895 [Lentisphaerae bacterium RIFOXYA12_64_32]OGV88031.1 MAG: hypothetical protein A3K19_26920 [Lentisphaerae bacterium RIFOXYB12_FULL_65_16]